MKILFVHEVNYETKPIFEMHEFPELLAALGHTVGFVQFPEGRPRSFRSAKCQLRAVQGRVIKDSFISLYTPGHISGSFFGRLIYACTIIFSLAKIFHQFRPDVIVCYSVPTSGWQTVALAKRLGVPVVFRAIDQPQHIRKTVLRGLISLAERFIYRNVNWISANNPAIAAHCHRMGAHKERVSVDLPPLDINFFAKIIDRGNGSSLPQLPRDARVTVFLGTFFHFAGVESLIRSFSVHSKRSEYLVLIGDGISRGSCEELVNDLRLNKRVIFTGFLNYESLPEVLSRAEVAVNSMTPSHVTHNALPNKVLQYLASGLVTVSTRLEGLALTFPNSPHIVFAQTENDIYLDVRKLLDSKKLPSREEVRDRVSEMFPNGYSASNLETVLTKVLNLAT